MAEYQFRFPNEHIAYEGTHAEPLKHFDEVYRFLEEHFPVNDYLE